MQSDSSNAGGGLLPENARQALQAQYGAEIITQDYRGRAYGAFHARSNPWGRGFVVYGRGFGVDTYSGALVMVCARPAKPSRRGAARRGFATKREAQSLADSMNQASFPTKREAQAFGISYLLDV